MRDNVRKLEGAKREKKKVWEENGREKNKRESAKLCTYIDIYIHKTIIIYLTNGKAKYKKILVFISNLYYSEILSCIL